MARYIDADLLETEEIETADCYGVNMISGSNVRDWIDNQPTADVKEVVHGKWIKPYALFSDRICSYCGYKTTIGHIKTSALIAEQI